MTRWARGRRTGLAEVTPDVPPPSIPALPLGGQIARYAVAWLAGALPAFAVITALWLYPSDFSGVGEISLGAFALMFPVAVRQLNVPRRIGFVYFLLAAGVVFSVVSILTGAANGLTNEPFTTPRYAALLLSHRDPYVVPLVFNYVQYGQLFHSQSVYLYGPLLTFLQVPGLPYKWFALGCWVVLVLVVRRRFDVAVLLAQPYVAIVAANGYNDLAVLVFLTLGFAGWEGRRQKWAEWLSLGMKQFANVFVLVYYAVRREWGKTLLTAGISAAFIVPFYLWSGPAVLCPAVAGNLLPGCTGNGPPTFLLNYSLWVVWVVALFYPQLVDALRHRAETGWTGRLFARTGIGFDDLLRLPAFVVVGVSGVFVNLCVFTLFGIHFGTTTELTLLASVAAFGVALIWNFTWNRAWAFQGRGGDHSAAYHLAIYGVIQASALGVNLVVLALGVTVGLHALDSQLLGVLLGSVIGYAANLRFNFRKAATVPSA
jgi:putative flippase GtrA